MSLLVDLGRFEPRVIEAIGPGSRAGIWVRGCPFRCSGCCSPEFQRSGQIGHAVTVSEIIDWIKSAQHEYCIEGITFSGGEPFQQAEALAVIGAAARQLGLSVQCWTGYTLEELQATDAPAQAAALLRVIDVLIDGRFVQDLPNAPMRGSTNQRIHFLTGRYSEGDYQHLSVELRFDPQLGTFTSFGVLRPKVLEVAARLLGVTIESD
jgi:anaerobic ribonucleoside-triphosphate reductase activating protein